VWPHDGPFAAACLVVLEEEGWRRVGRLEAADVAIAPLLRRRLSAAELYAPRLGTLIFHPSLLPRRRGPDAVRWTIADGDEFTGVTWFWANEEYDAGDVCEQELVGVPPNATPLALYRQILIPAGIRCLRRALTCIGSGVVRKTPQDESAATYQPRLEVRA